MKFMQRLLAGRQGYTIDQTILIVAIIAILITMIIMTIGWQLINRSSGTKLGSQLRQIEDANGQFYSDHRVWPHQAVTTESAANDILALAGNTALGWQSNVDTTRLRNLVPGYAVASAGLTHGYGGSTGLITQRPATTGSWGNIGNNVYMVVQLTALPIAEAREADKAIDGTENATQGRVVYGTFTGSTCLPTTSGGAAGAATTSTANTVTLCYAANTIQ